MEIRRIMVGVDFSEPSNLAMRTALRLARRLDADIDMVHVCNVPEWPEWLDDSMQETARQLKLRLDDHLEAVRQRFQELHERYDGRGVEISQAFRDGSPSWGLVDAARELAPDLIVVGSRGRSPIEQLLLGSVAARVVRHAPVPVLVVRDRGAPASGFERVLIATDFSVSSIRALELGQRIATRGSRIDLVNCWRLPGTSSWNEEPEEAPADGDPLAAAFHAQVEEAGVSWAAGRSDGTSELRFHLVNQTPVHGVLEWIRKHDCDLVVLGRHGQGADHRAILGSVAASISRRAPCSVLIAR